MAASGESPGTFEKYEKMGEHSGGVGAAAGSKCANSYVVTEKVHGANFCLIAFRRDDGTNIVNFAKRTAVLGTVEDAEDFYSCRSSGLLRDLAPRAEAVLQHMSGNREGISAVHVFGELFGGSYPHPEIPAVPGLEPVQVGVWYAPNLQFMAFDIVVVDAAGTRSYLDYAVAREACRAAGLFFAEPLCEGTLAECLDFEIEFETRVPARLGLPPLPLGVGGSQRNLAEGVVIRPATEPPRNLSASARVGKESLRGLFKRKITEFSEKRYQNDDWKKGKAGGGGRAPALAAEELARMEMMALVTEQRLANVLSKIGRVDPSDRAACRQVLNDLKEDVCEALDDGDAETVRSSLNLQQELDSLCRELITLELVGGRGRRRTSASGAGSASD